MAITAPSPDTVPIREIEDLARRFAARHLDGPGAVDPDALLDAAAEAGLVQVALPEALGGAGLGALEGAQVVRVLAETAAGPAMVVGLQAAALGALAEAGADAEEVFDAPGRALAIPIPEVTEGGEVTWPEDGLSVNASPTGRLLVPGEGSAIDLEPATCGEAEDLLGLEGIRAARVLRPPWARGGGDSAGAILGRVSLAAAAAAAGVMAAATDRAAAYAAERYQGGRLIIDHSHLRDLLGRMRADCASARALVDGTAARGLELDAALAAKITVTDAAVRVTSDAVQLLGGYGYMRGFGLEGRMRDAATLARLPISNIAGNLVLAARR